MKPSGKLRHASIGALLAAMAVGPLPASADDYPLRPVTLVVGLLVAGGAPDDAPSAGAAQSTAMNAAAAVTRL